jgi:Rieske Fe-S protein
MEQPERDSTVQPAAGQTAGRVVGRRRFMKGLLGASAVSMATMIVAPIIGFLIPPKREAAGAGGKTPVGSAADLPIGSGKVVAMGSSPVIVVNTQTGVKAYSAVCTHLGCIVEFDATLRQIVCPCHDGHFSPDNGSVISGPPPKALPPVTVEVDGKDQIFLVSA